MVSRRRKHPWAKLWSWEPGIERQYLYEDKLSLWIGTRRDGNQGVYGASGTLRGSFRHAMRRREARDAVKVLTIRREPCPTRGCVIAFRRRAAYLRVAVEGREVEEEVRVDGGQRRIEIDIDDNLLYLTQCACKQESFVPDAVFQSYTIDSEIATCGAGVVYKVTERCSGDKFALKVARCHKNSDACVNFNQAVLEREIATLRRLDHPNIVRLVACDAHPLRRHLVMELALGGDLNARVSGGGALVEEEAKLVFAQILSALSYLHESCAIAHRDVKPRNVVLMRPRRLDCVKLVDFGLSRSGGGEGGDGSAARMIDDEAAGSVLYMPPILLRNHLRNENEPHDAYKSDVWSLGVSLYFALTRKYPFRRGVRLRGYCEHAEGGKVKEFRPGYMRLTPKGRDVIDACLAPDEQRRPSTVQLAELDWFSETYDEIGTTTRL